jgi:hypothetical protein
MPVSYFPIHWMDRVFSFKLSRDREWGACFFAAAVVCRIGDDAFDQKNLPNRAEVFAASRRPRRSNFYSGSFSS